MPRLRLSSRHPSRGRRALTLGGRSVLLAAAAAVVTALAVPASAAPTCTFDGATATATVAVGEGESAVISRSGDAITLDGAPCDTATVSNTDAIVVNGTGVPVAITIDLGGGDFAPGLTAESDANSEIEFTINLPAGSPTLSVVGGAGGDNVVVGATGINLNAAESTADADVTINGLPGIVIEGRGGNDVLSVAGESGTGGPATASLGGGTEDDRLLGANGGSTFDGGEGADSIDYGAATAIDASLAAGVVTHTGGATDQISAIENVEGSPGNDRLIGDQQQNALAGEDGDDRIEGGPADDTLNGGSGIDTAVFGAGDGGVDVDLGDGTASGEGADTLAGFENVMGTRHADTIQGDDGPNKLAAGAGKDEVSGNDGSDALRGGPGNDELNGQKGRDGLVGGPGKDQLDGGNGQDVCKGGPDPDSFVFCERITLG